MKGRRKMGDKKGTNLSDPTKVWWDKVKQICKLAETPLLKRMIFEGACQGCLPNEEQVKKLNEKIERRLCECLEIPY